MFPTPSEKEKPVYDILICDDEDAVRGLVEEIVRTEGFSFLSARSGKEAFGKAMENEFRLILMDMKMPDDWDGLTAIRSMEFCNENRRVIVVSAWLDDKMKQDLSEERNVIGWIEKPFDPAKLVSMIRLGLGQPLPGTD